MSDTIGENELQTSCLIFETFCRSSMTSADLAKKSRKRETLATAQTKMNAVVTERRIRSAFLKDIQPAVDKTLHLGSRDPSLYGTRKKGKGRYILPDCTG